MLSKPNTIRRALNLLAGSSGRETVLSIIILTVRAFLPLAVVLLTGHYVDIITGTAGAAAGAGAEPGTGLGAIAGPGGASGLGTVPGQGQGTGMMPAALVWLTVQLGGRGFGVVCVAFAGDCG